ncbi:MAG: hypothetical protein ACJ0P1_02435 [Flavobacteriaceae bacterium]|jgi:hypothetical protein|tara:strand:+ start:1136 stop:1627 length:492 start_codon:yes stop_codon:yes gene_type:complete
MKKIILSAFFVLLIMNLNAQKSTGSIKVTDELTIKVKKLLDDYVSNDFNSWESFHSDEMICYFNNSLIDKKTMIAGIKQDHLKFNGIQVSMDDYAHTNYFKDGEIWTNQWFEWNGTGNFSGLRYSIRVHVDQKWENGKIVQSQFYFDPTALKLETDLFLASQK